MAKYIDREALVEWLKRIPLKDLSDGLGLCRVIMEDDFKKAIKKMPKGIIVDAVPVVRCKDCKWFANNNGGEWFGCWLFNAIGAVPEDAPTPDDFCSKGERKGRDDGHTMWASA